MEQIRTALEHQIENYVTMGRGYVRPYSLSTPYDLTDTEIGLQMRLAGMDADDKKVHIDHLNRFYGQVNKMIMDFHKLSEPLTRIADVKDFNTAYDSVDAFLNQ